MKNKLHTTYKIGNIRVPSVTTIIESSLGWNKASLISWAAKTAQAGNDPDKIKHEAASIGTLTHKMIEDHTKGLVTNLFSYSQSDIDQATIGFNAFLKWETDYKPQYLQAEVPLVSNLYHYGGTIDTVIGLGDSLGVLDLKTSKGVYQEYIIQIAAYRQLYTENCGKLDFCSILKLDKITGSYEYHTFSDTQLDKAFEAFTCCLTLYNLKSEI